MCLDQASGLTFEQAHAIGMAGKCLDAHICMPACAKVEAAPFAPGRERCGLTRSRVGGLTRLGFREPHRGSHRPQRVISPVLLRPRCAILGWGSEAPFTKIRNAQKRHEFSSSKIAQGERVWAQAMATKIKLFSHLSESDRCEIFSYF